MKTSRRTLDAPASTSGHADKRTRMVMSSSDDLMLQDSMRFAPAAWHDDEALACADDRALRVLTSRWLGRDDSLTLYGGGNTSIKAPWPVPGGGAVPGLLVKGSGADLAEVTERDFTPIRLEGAVELLSGPDLDNDALMAALEPLKLDATAPRPSIETLLHASLPARFVEHTHADTALALIDTEHGEAITRKVYGEFAAWVPFRHSGFDLARVCADVFARDATPSTRALLLANHGVVAFGDSARESFDNMLELVRRAEGYLRDRNAWTLPRAAVPPRTADGALTLARLRQALARASGFIPVLCVDDTPETLAFVRRPDLDRVAREGPPTPQHAVFTKRWPALGLDVDAYVREYEAYGREAGQAFPADALPDPAPRVLLDPVFGMIALSVDGQHARMTARVYAHDIAIITRANAHDRYKSLPADAVMAAEVHYGGFDRKRLERRSTDLPLLGCVIGVTAALDPTLRAVLERAGADLAIIDADADAIRAAYAFGGVDAHLDAGEGPPPLAESLLGLAPRGGRVIDTRGRSAETIFQTLANHWTSGDTA